MLNTYSNMSVSLGLKGRQFDLFVSFTVKVSILTMIVTAILFCFPTDTIWLRHISQYRLLFPRKKIKTEMNSIPDGNSQTFKFRQDDQNMADFFYHMTNHNVTHKNDIKQRIFFKQNVIFCCCACVCHIEIKIIAETHRVKFLNRMSPWYMNRKKSNLRKNCFKREKEKMRHWISINFLSTKLLLIYFMFNSKLCRRRHRHHWWW